MKLVEPSSQLAPREQTHRVTISIFSADGEMRRLWDIEADVIRLAWACNKGTMLELAQKLGLSRSTLYRKIDEFGLNQSNVELLSVVPRTQSM
jgi:DNA-binding NtrC family response regulator